MVVATALVMANGQGPGQPWRPAEAVAMATAVALAKVHLTSLLGFVLGALSLSLSLFFFYISSESVRRLTHRAQLDMNVAPLCNPFSQPCNIARRHGCNRRTPHRHRKGPASNCSDTRALELTSPRGPCGMVASTRGALIEIAGRPQRKGLSSSATRKSRQHPGAAAEGGRLEHPRKFRSRA